MCDVTLPEGTQITLTAAADTGSQFDNWSGACTNSADCMLTMDSQKSVTGNFSLTQHELMVSLIGDGGGKVTSQPAGIDCGEDCNQDYDYNTNVALSPAADSGSTFSGWSGACSGAGACEVTMTAPLSVGAEFSFGYGYSVYIPLGIR